MRGGAAALAVIGIAYWAGPKAKMFMSPFDYYATMSATIAGSIGFALLVWIALRSLFSNTEAPAA
jgi:hypothetical protein